MYVFFLLVSGLISTNQVESSRQMYHAVMEEVARFLERCYQSFDSIQKSNQLAARSKFTNSQIFESLQLASPLGGKQQHNGTNGDQIHQFRSNDINDSQLSDVGKQQLNDSFTSSITTTSTETVNTYSDFTW